MFSHPEGIWGHCSVSQHAAQCTKLVAKTANCSWRKIAGAIGVILLLELRQSLGKPLDLCLLNQALLLTMR
jgi:hypothetical protein